ncbi:MAG: phosphotransferase [Anaerolineales bacterium]|nr:phosphotransferase [Anaerolineales bacterium]
MNLPTFTQIITDLHGETGQQWLNNLPKFLASYAERWNLTLLPPFENLTYHYVCPALRADSTPAVFKAHLPLNNELDTEAAALYAYGGKVSIRLLEADPDGGAILIERVTPGHTLVTLPDDDQTTRLAAQAMKRLWVPVPDDSIWQKVNVPDTRHFPTTAGWAKGLERLRPTFDGTTGPFPTRLVEMAERISDELHASPEPYVLLHGDLHHFNLLSAEREPWLIIDPKGLIGEPAYETGALLRNPIDTLYQNPAFPQITARRVDILAETLQLDRQRIIAWGITQAVQSAWDDWENHQQLDVDVLRLAEVLEGLQK